MSQNAELTKCQTKKEPIVLNVKDEQIFGVIHRPLVEEKTPALLMLHGFGSTKIGKHRLSYQLAEELATNGITVLRIDFRGCGDSDRSFQEMSVTTQIEDGLTALAYLTHDSQVDPERIGLLGRSLGAAIAVKCASQFPVKALALWVPFFAPSQYEKALQNHPQDKPIEIDGKRPGMPFLKEVMGLHVGENLKALSHVPLFHAYAGQDRVLEPSHQAGYCKTRGEGHIKDRLLLLGDSDHVFSRFEDRKKILEETKQWLTDML